MTKTIKENELNPIDIAIGSRIRDRRNLLRMSQANLAEKLGITFQQVQKYENGKNRVSVSRLVDICVALRVPLERFVNDLIPDDVQEEFKVKNYYVCFKYRNYFSSSETIEACSEEEAKEILISKLKRDNNLSAKHIEITSVSEE